jgi:hypothetical protein
VLFGMTILPAGNSETTVINHAVEIYNPTDNDINLANYSIKLTTSNTSVVSINLSGTILSKRTFVLSNAQSSTSIYSLSNQTSSNLNFSDITVLRLVSVCPYSPTRS